MIPITDQDVDATWRATIDNEIARDEWLEAMADAQLTQAAHNLGLMVLCMTGGPELDELVQTIEYEDWQEDEAWMKGGC